MLSSFLYKTITSFHHIIQSLYPAFLIFIPTKPHRQQLMSLMLCPSLYPASARLWRGQVLQLNHQKTILSANHSTSKLHLWIVFLLICTGLFACSFFFLLLKNPGRIFMVSGASIWEERLFPSGFCSHLHFLCSRYQEKCNCCLVLSLCNSIVDDVRICPAL